MTGKESPKLYFEIKTSNETRDKSKNKIVTIILFIIILLIIIIIIIIIYHSLVQIIDLKKTFWPSETTRLSLLIRIV